MDKSKKLEDIFNRYLNNQCTNKELKLLLKLINKDGNEVLFKKLIRNEFEKEIDSNYEMDEKVKANLEKFLKKIKEDNTET